MRAVIPVLIGSAISLFAGCDYDRRTLELPAPAVEPLPEAPPAPATPENARDRLQASTLFALESSESVLEVSVGRHAEPKHPTLLALGSGKLAIRATPAEPLALRGLEAEVEDVVISKETIPPDGLHLTGIHATLTFEDVTAEWDEGENRATFEGRSTLEVAWSLATDDGVFEGRPLVISEIPVTGALEALEGDELAVELGAQWSGLLVDWGDLIEVSDLSFHLKLKEQSSSSALR